MNSPYRLGLLLNQVALKFELPCKIDSNYLGGVIGVPDEDGIIYTHYVFSEDGDSYEYGAALGYIDISKISEISTRILRSDPIRGLTERIDEQQKLITMGFRQGMNYLSDEYILNVFMTDVAGIAEAKMQYRPYLHS